jgi:hypothetical protein
MSNLTPEVHVNKNGVPVIKHVRADQKSKTNGFLSRIVPTLNGGLARERAEMLSDLDADLQAEQKAAEDAHELAVRNSHHSDPEWEHITRMRSIEHARRRLKLAAGMTDPSSEALHKFSNSTIRMIHDAYHGSGVLTRFLKRYAYGDEELTRSAVVFRNTDLDNMTSASSVFRDVRSSLGIKKLSSIEPGTPEHESVSSVLRVAIGATQRRAEARSKSMHSDGGISAQYRIRNEYTKWFKEEDELAKMSPQLAGVAADYPDFQNKS